MPPRTNHQQRRLRQPSPTIPGSQRHDLTTTTPFHSPPPPLSACSNFIGTSAWLDAMEWHGRDAWLSATRYLWKLGPHNAGYYKSEGRLGFLVVRNSGHMVPMDRPKEALDLVYRFTRGFSFADEPLPAPWLNEAASNSRGGPRGSNQSSSLWYTHERLFMTLGAFAVGAIITILGSALYATHAGSRRTGYHSVSPLAPAPTSTLRVFPAAKIRI